MLRRAFPVACFVVLVLEVARPSMALQGYGSGSQLSAMESNVTQQLHSVEKSLESAHKELGTARKDLAKTEAEHQRHAREYNSLHQQVQKEADTNSSLTQARKVFSEAERAFHDERDRVLKQLKTTADYQRSLEQKQSASSQLKSLADGDAQETRASLAKQIADLTSSLSTQESQAITANPEAKKAQQQLREAEQTMAERIRERNQSIDKDSRLNSEKAAFDRARSDHEAAKRHFAQVQASAAQAERAYQSLMHEKLSLDQQRAQQQRSSRYSTGRGGLSRRHYNVGPLGGALRIIPPPTVIIH